MGNRLEARVAIVTGASRGLGRAIAIALAAEGAHVAVAARTEQVWDERLPGTIGETVATIEAAGGKAVPIRADLLEPGDTVRLVEQTREKLGPISILINNAAFTASGRPPKNNDAVSAGAPAATAPKAPKAARADWPGFVGTPLQAYRRHFEIGVFASYELMQLVAPDMASLGGGAIVNISSGASRMPGEGPFPDRSERLLPGYGGGKAALEHLTNCAGYELADHNIVVNALSPSNAILTPGVLYYSKDFDNVGSEEDFAEATIRLCLIDPNVVTGRTMGHLDVLNGSYASFDRWRR